MGIWGLALVSPLVPFYLSGAGLWRRAARQTRSLSDRVCGVTRVRAAHFSDVKGDRGPPRQPFCVVF